MPRLGTSKLVQPMNCQIKCSECPDSIRATCKQVHNPKPYLNQKEQELLWTLGAVIASVEETLKEVKCRRNDVENQRLIKCLELMGKLGNRATDILTGDLPMDKFMEYMRRLGKREFIIKDKGC